MNIRVNIVTYNSAKTIKECIESVLSQTHPAALSTLCVIDNASSDTTLQILAESFPHVRVIKNATNTGFAAAHNQGIRDAQTDHADAVLILNPDAILVKDYVATLSGFLATHPRCSIASGRLYRWDIENDQKTDIIDSDGLVIYPSMRIAEDKAGQQEGNTQSTQEPRQVFGVSGAACMVRMSALETIRIGQEYFDEHFFIYKEDIDLCWRLWLAGFDAWMVPRARGSHVRGVKTNPGPTLTHVSAILASRKSRSRAEQFHSFKNQQMLMLKNMFLGTLIRNFFSIILYEIKLAVLALVFKPFLIKSWIAFLVLIPATLRKRRIIMKKTTRTASEFQLFLNHHA